MPPIADAPMDGTRVPPTTAFIGTPGLPQFWLTTTRHFAHLTMWLHGDLDLAYGAQLVSAACSQLAIGRTSGVTVDLGGLDFLSVTGISALIDVRHIADERAVPFELRNVPERITRLFRICGVTHSSQTQWHRWVPVSRRSDGSSAR